MLWRELRQIAVLFLLGAALTACGFQLKGSRSADSQSLDGVKVAVIAANPRSELTVALNQALKLSGAQLVPASEGDVLLRLGNEQFSRRNLALTAQARAAEVELTLSTTFSINRANRVLVDNTGASVTRLMLDDPSNVVGKNEEMRLLRGEMRRDVAGQIVRRAGHSLGN
ncbi:MAG: LPS assembly lipoprotein LptE [Halieaceae bacterium]|jgi:LPS-assembly lipoprotein|nr:LPS assembly lipoprotein LptE [Halieaceae bacterium]